MERVKLFTKQNDKTLPQLQRAGRLINNPLYVKLHLGDISPYFLKKYKWLTREAARRLPKPNDVKAPIWCAVSPRSCMVAEPGTLVYCLEVPRDQILFFDNMKWDHVLNQIYLPKDKADEEAYKKHLKDIGVNSRFDFTKDLYRSMFPEEIQRIQDSWQRIFDLDDWNIWNVCANIWEIREEWVTQILYPGDPVDMDALSECGEGVVLYETWPPDFKQLEPHDVEGQGAEDASGTEGDSPIVFEREFRDRLVVK